MASNVSPTYNVENINVTFDNIRLHSKAGGISRIVQICFTFILCMIMFAVGCAGDVPSIVQHFRRPAAICTGIFNQFIMMPLLALAFVYSTQMNGIGSQMEAMAVLIQGTAPGGMMSNIITYWMEGDINLSISMTTLSTLIALGSMPLWLFIFTHLLQIGEHLRIPFPSLGIALVAMVLPLLFGMIVRRYKPKPAAIITKVLTVLGTIAIIITLIVSGIVSELSFSVTWRQWLIAALTPLLGILLGYLTSSLPCLKLSNSCRRTIAIETGMQNCQISQSVLVISYATNVAVYEKVRLYPLLNAFFQILYGIVIALTLTRVKCVRKMAGITEKSTESKKDETEVANRLTAVDQSGSEENLDGSKI